MESARPVPRKWRNFALLAAVLTLAAGQTHAAALPASPHPDAPAIHGIDPASVPLPGASQALPAISVSSAPASDTTSLAYQARRAYWRGKTCLTPGCASSRASRLADTAAFGIAILGIAWLSRRRAVQTG